MVKVVSCRFLRLSCSEADHPLFRRYYARSNRERGVKLLRCFPHCCPEHVQRCYCGSSIHVLVTFAAELPAARRADLVVCARFEPSRVVPLWPTNLADAQTYAGNEETNQSHERKLQPGEVVSLPETLLAGGHHAKQTAWIRADREGESKQTAKNATLYVLNNHRFPKWLYSYDSSITRTQREMTHHLVVYVCQLTGTRSQQGEVDAAVLARHESPGFSLISYRRSGNNSRDAGCDLPAVELSSDTAFASVEINHSAIRSEDMDIDSYDQASSNMSRAQEGHHFNAQDQAYEEQWQPQHRQQQQQREHGPKVPEEWNEDWKWREQNPSRHPAFRYRSSYASQAMKEDFQEEDAMNDIEFRATVDIEVDDVLWQKEADIREPGFREKTQHLVILWRFLQHVSLSNLKISVDTMEAHVHSHWLRAAAALRAPVISFSAQLEGIVASFLSNIFSSANRATQAPLTDAEAHSAHDQATIRASVYLFLRALSSRNVQHLLREACRIGSGEMNKSWLQERFISLVLDLYDILGDVLREVSVGARANAPEVLRSRRDVTLPALVDNVLSLIYGRTHFSVLRDDVSSLLLNRQTSSSLSDAVNHAFRAFVVQAHEASVSAVAHARPDARHQQLWGESSNAWSRRWLLDPGSVQLNALDHNTKRDVRCGAAVIAVAQLVRELGCIDIVVSKGSMSLRTALSFDGIMAMAPMELVLDGRLRGFRVLPSGISSMFAAAGRWFVGDYEAVLSDDGQSVNLNFFAFVEEKTAADARRGREGGGASATVRRVSLSLILEQDFDDKGPATSTQPRDLFIVVHGTVLGSTYTPTSASAGFSAPRRMLSTMSSADRVLVWNELRWTPLFEVQAGYVAL